ncbi:phage holin family protein [Cyanobium sp. FGCU-52]|nr:phage holin family protein [Cyanobium sp. FGCU52]
MSRERLSDGREGGRGFTRVTALMSSVMDLHVRIALQEADREKRRLIGGGVFLGMGIGLAAMAALAAQMALLLWAKQQFRLDWIQAALLLAAVDGLLAALCLRLGGGMLKGPFLPQTTAGLMRTTRALTGRF